jgi:transposase, IS30 family
MHQDQVTGLHDNFGAVHGDLAHARARQRARWPRRTRISRDAQLREIVQALPELEWSPEQIAAHLRLTYPDVSSWHVCHETIYRALYDGGKGGLSRTLTAKLRTDRPLRRHRRRADARRSRFVAPAQLIDRRPIDLPRAFRTALIRLAYAASCPFVHSSSASWGDL